MRYHSTRGGEETDLVDAVMRGLATDGGLFVPDELPRFAPGDFRGDTLAEIAAELLTPFFAGSGLEAELGDICRDALDFPVPLRPLIEQGGEDRRKRHEVSASGVFNRHDLQVYFSGFELLITPL